MRVYVPVVVDQIASTVAGAFEPAAGYAVTSRLLDITAVEDDEELSEQVRDAAAADSVLELGSPRRAVVVVDYPRADVTQQPGGHPAAVTLRGKVAADAVACAFVDEESAEVDGKAAAAGDTEALERLEQHDLLWYDVTEIASL